MSAGPKRIEVTVAEIVDVNELVKRFVFKPTGDETLPSFSGGSHTVVEMQDGDTLRRNPYSLMSDPLDQSAYAISVRRDDNGRGGSLFLHKNVKKGDTLQISYPVNLFPLDLRARKHLFIAGGIGITPFLSQIKQLSRLGGRWELHYACRTKSLSSYADWLAEYHRDAFHLYLDELNEQIDLEQLLSGQAAGTHLYVCGPAGLIAKVRSTAAELGWPENVVHYEEFLAPQPGKPFLVELATSAKSIEVRPQESLLEAIERAGVNAPYMCRGGACGQCETRVISHDGVLQHHDHWLDEEERSSGKKIMPCVSRFEGKTLILDR